MARKNNTDNNSVTETRELGNNNCTKHFLMLLISPNSGWKRIKSSKISPADFERKLFYPLLALTALLQFCVWIYEPATAISDILRSAIVGFVSMFGAYFATIAVSSVLMPPHAAEKSRTPFFRVFTAVSLSVFDMAYLISLISPRLEVVMWFGLIYTLYIVCRGVKYLHLPQNERNAASIVACILIVGIPIAIYVLFTLLMPKA